MTTNMNLRHYSDLELMFVPSAFPRFARQQITRGNQQTWHPLEKIAGYTGAWLFEIVRDLVYIEVLYNSLTR